MPEPPRLPIAIVEYDVRWPAMFEDERARIVEAIGEWAVDIEHCGSTSVPGLASKPTIDIYVSVRSIDDANHCITPLEALGYTYRGEVDFEGGRYYKKMRPDGERTHNIHLCEASNPEWERHLLFRNYLRNHPPVALEYAALKRRLASKFGDDRLGYTNAKSEFVEACIAKAREEPEYVLEIVDYDERWPAMFEEERARILGACGEWLVDVYHVGSTSVPGLAAKPIIDMMPTLGQLEDAENCITPMESIGYEYVPQYEVFLPERRYFQKGLPRTHHAHMVQADTPFFRRHIEFRDYLRTHREAADEYAALKRDLAQKHAKNRFAYTDAKTDFIRAIEEKAAAAPSPSLQSAERGAPSTTR